MIWLLPVLIGATNATVTWPLPAVTLPMLGAPGKVAAAPGLTVTDAIELVIPFILAYRWTFVGTVTALVTSGIPALATIAPTVGVAPPVSDRVPVAFAITVGLSEMIVTVIPDGSVAYTDPSTWVEVNRTFANIVEPLVTIGVVEDAVVVVPESANVAVPARDGGVIGNTVTDVIGLTIPFTVT